MFGRYDYSLAIDDGILKLGVQQRDGLYIYYRELLGEPRKEKVLGGEPENVQLIIHPVEPISVPKQISLFLEIAFDPIVIPPSAERTIFLTFPIEFGVFLESGSIIGVLDTFSYVPAKYSLYGTPKTGVITKYHQSQVYAEIPVVDSKRSGVLQLIIVNPLQEFMEVSRAVFEAYGMVLYFDPHLITMQAQMTIHSSLVAETRFYDSPLRSTMQKGIEILKAKKVPMVGKHKLPPLGGTEVNVFLMEEGFA